jgi:hypothetical protein
MEHRAPAPRTLTARPTDNSGAMTTSSPVSTTVRKKR